VTTILSQETGSDKPKKPYRGLPLEGFLARWYARNTKNREDYGESARRLAGQIAAGSSILEVAPGPGYLALELARLGHYRVVGLDVSRSFVEMARRLAQDAGVDVKFEHGNAACMPFDSGSFDFIVCRAAFKNFSEPVRALQEMHRVLRPGGRALILDLRPDASPDAIHAEVKKMGLSWFNALITRFIFKRVLIKNAYSQERFRQMASQTAFKTCEIREDGIGLAVTLTKKTCHPMHS
jgi:ubiquinone/menaquinone biosynthesis C-methylase UbiE